tara:strand:- start:710 stop:1036 length:327 start_codon:yes stop_codon:yes gene_type:complete
MKTNKEIVDAFTNGETAENRNMFVEKDYFGRTIIYSYGRHFPLCLRTKKGLFIINKDSYSQSTSRQQTILRNELTFFSTAEKEVSTERLKELIGLEFQDEAELVELGL